MLPELERFGKQVGDRSPVGLKSQVQCVGPCFSAFVLAFIRLVGVEVWAGGQGFLYGIS